MKKKLLYFIVTSLTIINSIRAIAQSQINYNDFQGNAFHYFGSHSGMLDSIFINPVKDSVNSSTLCARYRRDSLAFDFLTFIPMGYLNSLEDYAKHDSLAKKFKMKIYSTAPLGTFIELQLGSTRDSSYPSGIHSQYQALTTKRNQWEEIEFNFSQIPTGSQLSINEVDKITLLFYPYSLSRDTFYFDDFMGPELIPTSTEDKLLHENIFSLKTYPNPAKNNTTIALNINKQTKANIKLYNSLGKEVQQICNKILPAGKHQIALNLSDLPEGIYFCTMDDEEKVSIEKLVVVR